MYLLFIYIYNNIFRSIYFFFNSKINLTKYDCNLFLLQFKYIFE
jgi:hypothetical protein